MVRELETVEMVEMTAFRLTAPGRPGTRWLLARWSSVTHTFLRGCVWDQRDTATYLKASSLIQMDTIHETNAAMASISVIQVSRAQRLRIFDSFFGGTLCSWAGLPAELALVLTLLSPAAPTK